MTPAEAGPLREAEERASAAVVGVETVEFLDGHADGVIEYGLPLRRDLAAAIRRHRPDLVVSMNYRETWGGLSFNMADHRHVGLAALDAARDAGNRWIFSDAGDPWTGVRRVALGGSPAPTHFVDLGDAIELGIASLREHAAYIAGLGYDFDPDAFLRGIARDAGEQCRLRVRGDLRALRALSRRATAPIASSTFARSPLRERRGRPRTHAQVSGPAAHAVGEVVDHAHRRVGEPELARHDALRRHRHADHVGVVGEQPDLGRGLEPGADRLPVHAAVVQRDRRSPARQASSDARAPRGVEPGHAVAALVGEGARRRAEGDEVVGERGRCRRRTTSRSAPIELIASTRSQPSATSAAHVGDVVDEVRRACSRRSRGAAGGTRRRGRARRRRACRRRRSAPARRRRCRCRSGCCRRRPRDRSRQHRAARTRPSVATSASVCARCSVAAARRARTGRSPAPGAGSSTCTPRGGAVHRVARVEAAQAARDARRGRRSRRSRAAPRAAARASAAASARSPPPTSSAAVQVVVTPVAVDRDHRRRRGRGTPASSGASAGSVSSDGTWRFRSSGCTIA